MRLLTTTLLLALSMSVNAMEWTGRFEIRDSSTNTTMCGSAGSCSANTTVGFGAGATTVWGFAQDWYVFTGGLLRQRVASISAAGTTSTATYLNLDIPAGVEWRFSSFGLRAAVDLSSKLSSTYSNITSSLESDNSFVTPVEVGFDWKFLPNQLANITYETGVTVATGQSGAANLATSNIITLGYGYQF